MFTEKESADCASHLRGKARGEVRFLTMDNEARRGIRGFAPHRAKPSAFFGARLRDDKTFAFPAPPSPPSAN